jgi:hypothetical protein
MTVARAPQPSRASASGQRLLSNPGFALFSDGDPLGTDELCLEILKGVIIKMELLFERVISYMASTLKRGQSLI